MSNILIYNAGPLFTEADGEQRKKEQTYFDSLEGISIFNPLTSPFNADANSAATIYEGDNAPIQAANVFFFDLASNDPGTLVELGMVIQKLQDGADLHIYPVISDFRVHGRNEYNCEYSPVGYNSFLIGALDSNEIKIYRSFDDAFKAFIAEKDGYR